MFNARAKQQQQQQQQQQQHGSLPLAHPHWWMGSSFNLWVGWRQLFVQSWRAPSELL
jgi:hypothetical protein